MYRAVKFFCDISEICASACKTEKDAQNILVFGFTSNTNIINNVVFDLLNLYVEM